MDTFELSDLTILDWLWLECARCGFGQSEVIRRDRPIVRSTERRRSGGLGPCACGSDSFYVIARRFDGEVAPASPVALPVLS